MAKKKPEDDKAPDPTAEADGPAAGGEQTEAALDQNPKVRKAADAVERAKQELHKAQQLYEDVRDKATKKLKNVREKSIGDLIDGTLELVKKYPGPGVILAAIVGFFLGRLFRR